MEKNITPKWAREIERFLSVKPQFVLWGNIYDVYPMEIDENIITFKMNDYLKKMLKNQGYELVVSYEPIYGFSLIDGNSDKFKEITGKTLEPMRPLAATLDNAAQMIDVLLNNRIAHCTVVLNFSSRLPEIAGTDINSFYYRLFRNASSVVPLMKFETKKDDKIPDVKETIKPIFPKYNLLIWTIDKENDLPAWYTLDNPKVKILSVPKPDYDVRRVVVESAAKIIKGFNELDEKKKTEGIELFTDLTNKLFAGEIISIAQLAKNENVEFGDIGEAIRRYKLGIVENPWSKLEMSKIKDAEELIGKRVKGQNLAVRKSSDIIKRSVFNLSGSQYSKNSQRPKGVLFFAGPTGVGKTELAKTITQLIFGSENSYIRFDMSEFAKEQSDQRLIGAPPGYVGYDVGGELTNSVKQNPFSVILFDEIEKANPKILDIFLQILDDGRLTSGRGETVYFSESLIIFTSNLGIYEVNNLGEKIQKVKPDMQYDAIEKSITESIEDFFKYKIGRPEILNRLGENIVVFDFIRQDVAKQIFDIMLKNVLDKLEDSYNIKIEIADVAMEKIVKVCCENLDMGGRGIGNELEENFVNPLSRALFSLGAVENDKLILEEIMDGDNKWEMKISKKSI